MPKSKKRERSRSRSDKRNRKPIFQNLIAKQRSLESEIRVHFYFDVYVGGLNDDEFLLYLRDKFATAGPVDIIQICSRTEGNMQVAVGYRFDADAIKVATGAIIIETKTKLTPIISKIFESQLKTQNIQIESDEEKEVVKQTVSQPQTYLPMYQCINLQSNTQDNVTKETLYIYMIPKEFSVQEALDGIQKYYSLLTPLEGEFKGDYLEVRLERIPYQQILKRLPVQIKNVDCLAIPTNTPETLIKHQIEVTGNATISQLHQAFKTAIWIEQKDKKHYVLFPTQEIPQPIGRLQIQISQPQTLIVTTNRPALKLTLQNRLADYKLSVQQATANQRTSSSSSGSSSSSSSSSSSPPRRK